MKTKRMITLLAAMIVGVLVSAQTFASDVTTVQEQAQQDYFKMMVMKYGTDLVVLFPDLTPEQERAIKTAVEKCKSPSDNSDICTQAIKKGGKLFPFFIHWPDEDEETERTF